MAEWLCRGLQILVQRFDSASGLHGLAPDSVQLGYAQPVCRPLENRSRPLDLSCAAVHDEHLRQLRTTLKLRAVGERDCADEVSAAPKQFITEFDYPQIRPGTRPDAEHLVDDLDARAVGAGLFEA